MEKVHLGVVDQSPIRMGGTASQALSESVTLAQIAEKLGYERYWVAEHHNSGGYAGTAPEILIGQIATQTSTIKVGSGGVMLSHYSAFKVAEVFRLLDTFFPERTLAKVLFPEPLGPMIACNSPGFIVIFNPLRISLLFIEAFKFLISSITLHFLLN